MTLREGESWRRGERKEGRGRRGEGGRTKRKRKIMT